MKIDFQTKFNLLPPMVDSQDTIKTITSAMDVDAQTSANANQSTTEQRAKIFAALADPTRLRIVELLAEAGEVSGSEIASSIGISLALFCHHSKTLSEAGLIQIRREGQTKYNSLNRELLANCFASFRIKLPER